MKLATSISALILVSTGLIAGCASNSPYQTSTSYANSYPSQVQRRASDLGVIESIYLTHSEARSSGAGVVVGGVVGGLLGNQIGSGSGKTAATVAGVVGGAIVGNNVEKNRNSAAPGLYEIRVSMNDGGSINLLQDSITNLRVGDRVRVVDGKAYLY